METVPANDDAAPLPGHVTWFAPWRWFATLSPWRRWAIIIGVLLVWYIESPIVIVPFARRTSLPYVDTMIETFYAPLILCYEASPVVHTFYDSQFEVVDETLTQLGW